MSVERETKLYKLRHKPTGLYYQPYKSFGSHLSKRGKIYQTSYNAFTGSLKSNQKTFRVRCSKNCNIFKLTEGVLEWEEYAWSNELYAETLVTDWELEFI